MTVMVWVDILCTGSKHGTYSTKKILTNDIADLGATVRRLCKQASDNNATNNMRRGKGHLHIQISWTTAIAIAGMIAILFC